MSELRNYEVKYVLGLIADNERLTAERTKLLDIIETAAIKIERLETALREIADIRIYDDRQEIAEAALREDEDE